MSRSHILGFPRIGSNRELKKAVEAYWRNEISLQELEAVGKTIEENNWQMQYNAGLDFVTVGDFSWYDHVLDMSALLGVIPPRFKRKNQDVDLNTIFCMARGQAPYMDETTACEMTKWFNTNYHYIVPEFSLNQSFELTTEFLFKSISRAQEKNYHVKPVLLGPLSFLWLGKTKDSNVNKLDLLDNLLIAYNAIFEKLNALNIEWVQIDEPILVLDLPEEWLNAFKTAYSRLAVRQIKTLLATYFGSIDHHLSLIKQLPVSGVHLDLCSDLNQLQECLAHIPSEKVISLGCINGRNIWRADISQWLAQLEPLSAYKERLWISGSCSFMHVPVDLTQETKLDPEIKNWLAFAKQKLDEVAFLSQALFQGNYDQDYLKANQAAIESRKISPRIHIEQVQSRVQSVDKQFAQRSNAFEQRALQQQQHLNLPLFPTTTIGSFPQTSDIRSLRRQLKLGKITKEDYTKKIQGHIQDMIFQQEQLELDVFVHGEPERNDMVEYFGELLQGFVFTKNGWVQSYGSRCVKPPIIYGDVQRSCPMTVEWSAFAQSLTQKPVKGMLTGPVTLLAWSFVRDDQPLQSTALQLAFALRDEVHDLERNGISIIQIDEPAFREALPLRKKDWQTYLDWAVFSFRIAACGVANTTQIHTHMCYSEFNDVIEAIAALDADVITLESSRSTMELLQAFENFAYPNAIGPGVYDIHSPRVPSDTEIITQLQKALSYIPPARLWVNPDCGLKTRDWPEVKAALKNMVTAAKCLRGKEHHKTKNNNSFAISAET